MTEEQMWQTGIGAAAGLVAIFLLFGGFKSLRRKRLIENVPTSKVAGVFLGLTEVKGTAEQGAPLRSYLAEVDAVWYQYSVEEHWRRTETYTDSKGNTRTRTRSGWKTVRSADVRKHFLVRDDTGRLRIDPNKAEMEGNCVFSRTCGRSDPLYYRKGPAGSIMDSTHTRRFSEYAIKPGERIYTIGTARLRKDVVEPEIAFGEEDEMFLISVKDEEAIIKSYAVGSFFKLLFGGVFLNASPCIIMYRDTDAAVDLLGRAMPFMLTGSLLYALVIFVYYLFLLYNGLVAVRNRLQMAWSMIDVQLKRRHDLIPNLVASVKGFVQHEKDVQESLATIRAETLKGAVPPAGVGLPAAGRAAALATFANQETHVLGGLFGIIERYPEIKADVSFRKLNDALSDTETKIALARSFYNESVTALNNRIETLPDALIAKFGNFRKVDYFKIEEFERHPVTVRFEEPKEPEPPEAESVGEDSAELIMPETETAAPAEPKREREPKPAPAPAPAREKKK